MIIGVKTFIGKPSFIVDGRVFQYDLRKSRLWLLDASDDDFKINGDGRYVLLSSDFEEVIRSEAKGKVNPPDLIRALCEEEGLLPNRKVDVPDVFDIPASPYGMLHKVPCSDFLLFRDFDSLLDQAVERGMVLYAAPGLGKSTLAQCFTMMSDTDDGDVKTNSTILWTNLEDDRRWSIDVAFLRMSRDRPLERLISRDILASPGKYRMSNDLINSYIKSMPWSVRPYWTFVPVAKHYAFMTNDYIGDSSFYFK